MFAVLGAGGVGGFIAAALAHADIPVTVVAREETARALDGRGIDVDSVLLGSFHADPPAVASLELGPDDTLVAATKADGLAAGLERVAGTPGLVVPLLNGLDHMGPLRARFGRGPVAAGSIRIVSDRPATGRIVHTSRFLRIDVAPRSALTERFAASLGEARVPVEVLDSEAQVLWGKLVRLNALACTTTAFDLPLGAIRDDPAMSADLRGCVEEAAAVARAEGADADPERTMAEIADAHAGLTTSMQRDVAAGRASELDAIAGSVLRAAARHGIACPTIGRLADIIRRRAR
jgi:2-dehydropantoate 2-reductase